jgi:hypothetical protein
MSFPQSVSVTVATIADGSGTGYTAAIRGRIIAVKYTKVDYPDGVDFTITTEDSLRDVWVDTNINATEAVSPKELNDGTTGSDLTGVYDHVRVFNERVKIVIAAGGDTKTGAFTVFYE